MFLFIVETVAPVFLLLLAGYVAVKTSVLEASVIDGVMKFCTHIAIPCLLFHATATIDLGAAYEWRVILAYFATASISFLVAVFASHHIFSRRPGEAVAVAFSTLFSNLLLLGIPIVERAFGEPALSNTIAVVSLNAPVCYFLGIVAMESVRADSRSVSDTTMVVINTMFRNTLMIGLGLGFLVNLSGLVIPDFVMLPIDMLRSAALPCALFGLGGLLTRYALSEQIAESSAISGITLFFSPLLAYVLCSIIGVTSDQRNMIVLLAAIPPGLNAYLFASLYSRGLGTASSNVLIGTALSLLTISFWLWVLLEFL